MVYQQIKITLVRVFKLFMTRLQHKSYNLTYLVILKKFECIIEERSYLTIFMSKGG